jgi:cobalamin biosynthesis protein CbiD
MPAKSLDRIALGCEVEVNFGFDRTLKGGSGIGMYRGLSKSLNERAIRRAVHRNFKPNNLGLVHP